MDPLTVLTTLWRHKVVAIPVVVLTMLACLYVYIWAPRSYEANVSYALTAPNIPSNLEIARNPDLGNLNSNNPYLRSNDSSLLTQVVIAKLSDPAYVDQLKQSGFGTDFKITPMTGLGTGLVTVTATSSSEAEAVGTARSVGEQFISTLNDVQKVNGADARYLYSPILVRGPGPATELFSSRLRSLIMVGIAGSVLLFGSVSVARARTLRRLGTAPAAADTGGAVAGVPSRPADTGHAASPAPAGRRAARRAGEASPSWIPALNELHGVSPATEDNKTKKDQLMTAGKAASDP